MKTQHLFTLSIFSFLTLSYPATAKDLPSNAIQTEPPKPTIDSQKPIKPQTAPESLQAPIQKNNANALTLTDIQNNPALAEQALNYAMLNKIWGAVEKILPIYRQQPNADPILIDYAQGALEREKGEYKKAIKLYRKLIAEKPEMNRVRMDLAILLFADKQDTAAKDQFIKLRSNPNNDELLNEIIDQYISAINQRASWSFNAGLSYIQDNNVNNASKSKTIKVGELIFQKRAESLPQKAHGIDFSLGASKDFNITGSNYLALDALAYGKVYWDNHSFDDSTLRLSTGYKYKDAKDNFSFLPFAKRRYAGGQSYSQTLGFSIGASRWLSPNWKLSTYNELAFEKSLLSESKEKPSEKQLFTSANVLWVPKATQYFTFGGSIFDVKNQNKSVSSTRYGLSTSWNQDWGWGISSNVNLGLGHKAYKGKHYLGLTRKDQDFSAGLTLWNRDWHAWGITPKISFRYNKVDSNLDDLYSYDKGTVFLQFDKTF